MVPPFAGITRIRFEGSVTLRRSVWLGPVRGHPLSPAVPSSPQDGCFRACYALHHVGDVRDHGR